MANFFNTNIINPRDIKKENSTPQMISVINKFLSSSKNVKDDYLNNTSRNIKYLGEGINGSMYKVDKLNSKYYYIIKVIKFNKDTYPSIKRELGLLKKIDNNPLTRNVINPCLDYYLSNNKLISIFNSFNAITLLEFIKQCHHKNIDLKTRIILLKYILKQCFHSIYQIHKINVCHLQINPHSILVKINVNKLENANNINSSKDVYTLYNNTNVVLDETNIDPGKLNATNYATYSIEDSKEPLQIKLTNFGLGCGILQELDSNLNITNKTNTANCSFYNNDPYLTDSLQKLKNIELGMHFDLFNTGLVGLLCLCKLDFITKNILDSTQLNIHINSITSFKAFLDLCKENLLDDTFNIYFENLKKYCLGELKNRKNSKFVQEKIILDEKHNNDSFW